PGEVTITASGTHNGKPFKRAVTLTVSSAVATTLQVTPAETSVPVGFEQPFTATALLSDGSALEVTDNAVLSWSSSDPAIATISNAEGSKGRATGVATGTVTITASGVANGTPFSATAQLEVTSATAKALQVTPATATVAAGFEQAYTATALLSDGRTLAVTDNAVLSWSSSDPAIATISNEAGSKGVATGVAPGKVTITASGVANGKPFSATAQLEVTHATATSLQVTPAVASVPVGLEQQFRATARLSDGRALEVTDNAVLSWSSSDPGIATISNEAGSKGLATGVATGTVTITASGVANGKPFLATAQLEVTDATATALQVTPATASVPAGFEQAFTATAMLSDGRALEVTDNGVLSWSSSDPTIATVSNAVGSKGVATGVSPGTVTITASGVANGQPFSATAELEVTEAVVTSLQVTPATATVAVGLEQGFTAMAQLSDGGVRDVTMDAALSWSSDDATIATVDSAGVATGV
ncbi:Ig-like domain-containing protein, partial [Aeromonas dhakensis]